MWLNISLCKWIQNLSLLQHNYIQHKAPQKSVLSPPLYSLYTIDCMARYDTNSIVKFVEDKVVVGLISQNAEWGGKPSNMVSGKSLLPKHWQEMVIHFKRAKGSHTPLQIFGSPVERVSCFKYSGVKSLRTSPDHLTWIPSLAEPDSAPTTWDDSGGLRPVPSF